MGKGAGFGKVILFNEHFVVYGITAIASAIDSKTEAFIESVSDPSSLVSSGREGSMRDLGWVLEDKRPANPGYKVEKFDHQKESINLVLDAADFNTRKNNIRITLGGDLKAVGGVGASAAVCVSIARALNDEFDLGFDDEKINKIAYEGEKAYAGTPSGIDNTASTFGGLLEFERNLSGGENRIKLIRVRAPIGIVMGNTGITANTKAAVEGVRERREKMPEEYGKIFEESKALVTRALSALGEYDLRTLGNLMDDNHKLLQRIEVSHPRLDELVEISRDSGAWGAKMTGGGLGGYMVALTPDPEIQNSVAGALEENGYEALKTSIGI